MALKYKTLADLTDCKGKKVLLRLDLNVPIQNGRVVDDFRIRQSLPTINALRERGAKIIIMSHIEGGSDTLRPVYDYLKTDYPITFCEDCLENGGAIAETLQDGDMVLFENLRLYDGEKKNDPIFAKQLAAYGDVYVNDAFSVSHRAHASVVGVPKFLPGYVGLQFEKEIENLSKAFNPPRPFLFILGGAKFDTKLPLVKKFLSIADAIFVGGALANDFFRAKGIEVGKSLLSDSPIDFDGLLDDPKIVLPADAVVGTSEAREIRQSTDIRSDDTIHDDGPASLAKIKELIGTSKAILWNGPLGNYENGFTDGTNALARLIADAPDAFSIVGGGDTLAAISDLGIEDKFSFVSTGGGAMLDFLANETLPGLTALEK